MRALRLVLPLVCTLVLAACAGPGPGRHPRGGVERPNAQAEALRAGAYRPQREEALSVSLQSWIVKGDSLPVSLAFPSGSGRDLPLIVYLPGLGDSAQAGASLRQAWARAGYAVLSVQPLAADERAWSSELARAADFRALARERRQADQQAARNTLLQALLDEAHRRAAAGDALWQRVDFSRLGLAGFELGAQTALALPGVKARLAIAPLAAAAVGQEPLLVIASRRDNDPLTGEPLAPRAREVIEAAADASLLMFEEASHAALSGSPSAQEEQQMQPERGSRGGGKGDKGGGGRGGGKGQRGGGGGSPSTGSGPDGAKPMRPSMVNARDETTAIAITATSTAFWDASLRASGPARAWLQAEAGPWLRGLADWQGKAVRPGS